MKSNNVYKGVFCLAFLLFLAASALCYCMIKDANLPEKTNTRMVVCCIIEVSLVVLIIISIIKGASRIFAETKSIEIKKDL